MMTSRAKVWWMGLALTTLLVVALESNFSRREWSLSLALLTLGSTATLAEILALREVARRRRRSRTLSLEGARPADGVVEVLPIPDLKGLANRADPRFRRFVKPETTETKDRSIDRLPTATSPLLGRVVILSVFVGTDGVSWSDQEIGTGHGGLERAAVWIEREAIKFGVPVNLSLADLYFQVDQADSGPVEVEFGPEGDDVGPLEANATTKAVVMASRAASSLGFADVADWMGRINARIEADATVWLFHVRQAGRSLAIPREDSGVPGVGFAVSYSKEASFPEPLIGRNGRVDPTTVAHELLHLFGASDKYGVSLGSFPKGSVSPREIMRLNRGKLERMTIDRLTAQEIGWSLPGKSSL